MNVINSELTVSLRYRVNVLCLKHPAVQFPDDWTHLQDLLQLAGGLDGHGGSDDGVQLLPEREETVESRGRVNVTTVARRASALDSRAE